MMPKWTNVYDYGAENRRTYAGRFDESAATRYEGAEGRDDATTERQELWRTAKGRWVRCSWTCWKGDVPRYWFIDAGRAREWLLENGHEDAVDEHFGAPGAEGPRRQGRPEIGGRTEVLLGHLLGPVDAWAEDANVLKKDGTANRSEAVRQLVQAALTHAGYLAGTAVPEVGVGERVTVPAYAVPEGWAREGEVTEVEEGNVVVDLGDGHRTEVPVDSVDSV